MFIICLFATSFSDILSCYLYLMELKEDSWSDSSEEGWPTAARRPVSILISSFNNQASIHRSIQNFEDDGDVKFRANPQTSQQAASNDDIVHICLRTKKNSPTSNSSQSILYLMVLESNRFLYFEKSQKRIHIKITWLIVLKLVKKTTD